MRTPSLATLTIVLFALPAAAPAEVVITVSEFPDVVFSGKGTVNLDALEYQATTNIVSFFNPFHDALILGASGPADFYRSAITPTSAWGTKVEFLDGTGDLLGAYDGGLIVVPAGYASGSPLAATASIYGQTFATLGLIRGTYVWSWGSGSTADKLTLHIGVKPEIGATPNPLMFGEVEIGTSIALPVKITNAALASADLVVSHLQITDDAENEFAIDPPVPSLPLTIAPGGSEDVMVRFTPAVEGTATATLEVTSDDPDVVLDVGLEGMAVAAESGFEEEIMAIMDLLMGDGVNGVGPGQSGPGRLQALNDMVETAGDLIRMDEIDAACGQLDQARLRIDGESPPPDFGEGEDAEEVHDRIADLQDELGCSPKP